MSKTFKNATNSGTEVYVGEGINADSVQLIIRNVGSGIGKAGIYLNSSDIPALALAILEAAGWPNEYLATTEILRRLRELDEHFKAVGAEAEAQAELEAEALRLANEFHGADWDLFPCSRTVEMQQWLAVARRAREINKEDNNGR